jgi:hypothetical protein
MSLLMAATVFAGFARTYFLAGFAHAPLPNLLIHVHGAAFSYWILLLVVQASLVYAGRVDIHRRLGIAGSESRPLGKVVPVHRESAQSPPPVLHFFPFQLPPKEKTVRIPALPRLR